MADKNQVPTVAKAFDKKKKKQLSTKLRTRIAAIGRIHTRDGWSVWDGFWRWINRLRRIIRL